MEYVGKYRDFNYKIFCLLLMGEGELPYIRRKGVNFIVTMRPLRHRFHMTSKDMLAAFRALEKIGYIYSFSYQASELYFKLYIPKWLTLAEVSNVTQNN
jgi:hypothetical protein